MATTAPTGPGCEGLLDPPRDGAGVLAAWASASRAVGVGIGACGTGTSFLGPLLWLGDGVDGRGERHENAHRPPAGHGQAQRAVKPAGRDGDSPPQRGGETGPASGLAEARKILLSIDRLLLLRQIRAD